MSESNQIYQLLPRVAADIGAIGKDDRNQHFNFNYRGIDAVYDAAHGAFVKHGVTIIPELVKVEREGPRTCVEMKYTLAAPDGSTVQGSFPGEAMDKQDKGTNKACTAAYKYFLFETFCIPVKGETPDADADGPIKQPQPARRSAETTKDFHKELRAQLGDRFADLAALFFREKGKLKEGETIEKLPLDIAKWCVEHHDRFMGQLNEFDANDDVPMP